MWLQLAYKTVNHYFSMLSKCKIPSGDILQGTSPGARRAFRKSAKKWDGDLEGGEGFPGGRKIGRKRRGGRGGLMERLMGSFWKCLVELTGVVEGSREDG